MKDIINTGLKYLSLGLVLSYFFVENIYLVIFGILVALIEITYNADYLGFIYKRSEKKYIDKILSDEIRNNEKKLNKRDNKLTLVERIEELGYIPSIYNDNDNDNDNDTTAA